MSRDAYMARDNALEMVETQGWSELARWVTEQAEIERSAMERGLAGWDDYQRSVGRLDAFRKVLRRPDELVAVAEAIARGDS